jgi:hypothetical protein
MEINFEKSEQSRIENNPESQQMLDDNFVRFAKQDLLVLNILLLGIKLDTKTALLEYRIGDLRRRIKTLRDAGFPIKDIKPYKRFKLYYYENI